MTLLFAILKIKIKDIKKFVAEACDITDNFCETA